MAHHQITFKRNEDGTYYAACSCGPTFAKAATREVALQYMEGHVAGLGVAFGVNTVGWSMQEPPAEPQAEEEAEEEEKPKGKRK